MPRKVTYTREAPAGSVMSSVDRRSKTVFLPRSYWPANDDGDRIANAGALCAIIDGGLNQSSMTGSQSYAVPYSPTGAYGTGSDTCDGILDATYDATFSTWQVTLATSGIAYETRCFVPGGTLGDIPAAAKTDLSNIELRSS